jgi:dienelactone hydrolase
MAHDHAREEELAARKHVNDYYPDIARFHENELLRFFDRLNDDYLVKRKRRFNAIQTREEALGYAEDVRASFAACLGEPPGGGPGRAEVVRTLDKGGYSIDNVLIEAMPGYFLNASFYYPKAAQGPSPAILFLCGHAPEGKAYGLYASFCAEAVANGFCVLTFDPVGHGERRMYDRRDSEYFTGSPDEVHYLLGQQAWLAGTSITSFMMLDNVRALDYLCSRGEADAGAVSVAGNSGGGHMAAFMGAYDPRVAAVVSSCYITELGSLIHHVGAQECEQSLPGFMERGLDLADLVIAAAPKPYFIGAALMDFFPIDGTRDAYIDARRIYALLGRADGLEIHVASKPHGFWRETREGALRFLCGRFGVPFIEDKDIDYDDLPTGEELRCLEGGDINDVNAVSIQRMLRSRVAAEARGLPDVLDAAGLRAFAEATRAGLLHALQADPGAAGADIAGESRRFDDSSGLYVSEFAFHPEPYMKVHATLYERSMGPKRTAALHVGRLEPGGGDLAELLGEFPAVFCVEARGTGRGAVEPGCYFFEPGHFENEEASYCCAAAMHGRSVAGMRALDALGAAKLLEGLEDFKDCRVTLSGRGEDALTALYAAVALGGRDVWLKDLLYSLKSLVDNRMYLWGPAVFAFGLLRRTDVPALLCALAGHTIRVDGFLDHMKREAGAVALGGLPEYLRGLCAIAGGQLEMNPRRII